MRFGWLPFRQWSKPGLAPFGLGILTQRRHIIGYSNILYAVDLDALKQVLKNGDRKLAETLRTKVQKKLKKTKSLRVEIHKDGTLIVGAAVMTLDELLVEIKRPKWRRQTLDLVTDSGKRQTPKQNKLLKTIMHADKEFHVLHLIDQPEDDEDEDEIPSELAAAELLEGRCTRPDCAHQYGYGLMKILDVVAKFVGTIPGHWDESIAWKTKLERFRSPVKLPKNDDFPYMSYLTAEEVASELKKFSAMELDGDEEWIREYRVAFLKILKQAAKLKFGVLCFYH